ncbi:hypothetical protein H0H93_015093 [Arthromyces matolae]|nr:hypothetical protein H0H93_015093 [Arthromyces matolae]
MLGGTGTWVQPDSNRPDVIRIATHGQGELYGFDEEAVPLPTKFGYGYYPVSLGDVILIGEIAQLRVIRKLGWGNGSTIWLCSLEGTGPVHWPKYVALKIETAFYNLMPSVEADCLDANAKNTTKGSEYCLQLLAHGTTTSVHGEHRVFVTPVTGPSLWSLAAQYDTFIIKNVIRQVLLGLERIHSSGFVHYDLQLENIVVALPNESLIPAVDDAMASFPPETYPLALLPYVSKLPYTTIKTQPFDPVWFKRDLSDMKVKIIDYGEGRTFLSQTIGRLAKMSILARSISTLHLITDSIEPIIVPEPIFPPERILGATLSEKVDIWAVGYMAMTMLTGADVFDPKDGRPRLYRMIEYLGPLKDSFLARCFRRDQFLREDGIHQLVTRETMPHSIYGLIPEPRTAEMYELMDFVYDCFKLDPEDRPSATQLLAHRWLNK